MTTQKMRHGSRKLTRAKNTKKVRERSKIGGKTSQTIKKQIKAFFLRNIFCEQLWKKVGS